MRRMEMRNMRVEGVRINGVGMEVVLFVHASLYFPHLRSLPASYSSSVYVVLPYLS